jgi:hypothetical protein
MKKAGKGAAPADDIGQEQPKRTPNTMHPHLLDHDGSDRDGQVWFDCARGKAPRERARPSATIS